MLFATWACVGRLDDLGLDEPGRLAVVDVVGESVVLTRDDDGLHAAYNVCRHRGSQLVPARRARVPSRSARPRARCAAPTTRGPTRWPAGCSRRRTPTGAEIDPADFSLHPVGVEEWAGFVFVNLTPPETSAEPFADGVAQAAANLGNYDMGSLVTGLTLRYDVAANWKVLAENYNECYHCGPVHPELVRLVPAFGGGGTDLAWEDGIPHREGAWTFTMSGTTSRSPLPGLSEAEKVRHKGELVYPNLMLSCSADHVAAFVLRPRRRRPDADRVLAAVRARRRRGRGLRPVGRRRLLGPGQQAGLGDLRVGAARDVVAGLHARVVRTDGGRQRRHPAVAAAPTGLAG